MKKTTVFFLILAVLSLSGVCQAAEPLTISRVIDSVTLQLSDGETVRLIGVDPLEFSRNTVLREDAKRRSREATEFTRKHAEGKRVRLEHDVQRKDEEGRTLAYVYISGPVTTHFDDSNLVIEKKYTEMFLNGALVGAGYAQAVILDAVSVGQAPQANVKHQDLFLRLQKEAQEQKRGLWK